MPLKKCSENENSGWKWGDSGKCYTGKDAKKKAIKQGVAIEGPKKFQQMASLFEDPFTEEDINTAIESMCDLEYRPVLIAATSIALKNIINKYGNQNTSGKYYKLHNTEQPCSRGITGEDRLV